MTQKGNQRAVAFLRKDLSSLVIRIDNARKEALSQICKPNVEPSEISKETLDNLLIAALDVLGYDQFIRDFCFNIRLPPVGKRGGISVGTIFSYNLLLEKERKKNRGIVSDGDVPILTSPTIELVCYSSPVKKKITQLISGSVGIRPIWREVTEQDVEQFAYDLRFTHHLRSLHSQLFNELAEYGGQSSSTEKERQFSELLSNLLNSVDGKNKDQKSNLGKVDASIAYMFKKDFLQYLSLIPQSGVIISQYDFSNAAALAEMENYSMVKLVTLTKLISSPFFTAIQNLQSFETISKSRYFQESLQKSLLNPPKRLAEPKKQPE